MDSGPTREIMAIMVNVGESIGFFGTIYQNLLSCLFFTVNKFGISLNGLLYQFKKSDSDIIDQMVSIYKSSLLITNLLDLC